MTQFIKNMRDYLLGQAFLNKTPEMKGMLPWFYLNSVHKVDPFALLFLSPDSKFEDWQKWIILNGAGRHFRHSDLDFLLINSFFNKSKAQPPKDSETQTDLQKGGKSRRKYRPHKTRRSSKNRYRRRSHH